MLKLDESKTTDENLKNLADHYAGIVRGLEDRRNRLTSSPNHPELRAYDIKAIDDQLIPARYRAKAAADGAVYHDAREAADCTREKQRWVSWARTLGRLVNPDNYSISVHDRDQTQPIKVIRGGDGAKNLGSPTISVR